MNAFILLGSAIPLLQIMTAFKSNPEKLADTSKGFLVDTLKEFVKLPSLVGKSDVRQEFASNLKDVVEALKPQRLVIFLDDLDRCKPDQVVQILEAVNFLSSAASCFIIIGAAYEKTETLVAMQFETIAMREAENSGLSPAPEPVKLRVEYARSYLKKIVNLRLNLRLPTPDDYAHMLSDQPSRAPKSNKWIGRAGVFAALILPIVLTIGIAQRSRQSLPASATETYVSQEHEQGSPTRQGSPTPAFFLRTSEVANTSSHQNAID